MTPGGRPAASSRRRIWSALSIALDAGFQITVLPINAGAVGRLPAIEVKLNGVTAYTKPSSGRYSIWFHRGVGADRLLGVEFLRVVRIEAPEVNQLRRGIDLRL